MSTEFTSATTDEVAFVRFFGGQERGACFEFGTVTNFENCCRAARNGEVFVNTVDRVQFVSVEDFEAVVVSGNATFGEFPVTVEVGSGEMFRFTEEVW